MEITPTTRSFRQYLIFWSGQLFSLFGSVVIQFVMIWWIERNYSNMLYLSLASFFFVLPMVVLMPLGGVLGDRYNKRKLIFTVDFLQALVTFILILIFTFNLGSIWVIFIFIMIRSSFQAIHQPTVSSVAPSMVPKDKLSRINGVNFLFSGLIQLIGLPLGAMLYLIIPFNHIFWIDIGTFLISIIPLAIIKIPRVREVDHFEKFNVKSFIKDLKEGFNVLRAVPGLLILLIECVFINFLLQPINVLLPYYIHEIHGGLEFEYSLISVLMNVGFIIGAGITSFKKKWNKKISTIFMGIIIIGIGYALLAFIPTGLFLIIGLIFFIVGIILPLINTIYQTILQISVPQDKIGRVTSIDMTFSMMVTPIGTLISGPIAIAISVQNLFLSSGIIIIFIIGVLFLFTNVRYIKYEEEAQGEEIIETKTEKVKEII
ncbi:MAG: MFS transporter [Promethearchaeota archaeon]|nr:MAG: MFS transporter [Candidatus Lokiarchaeota archaeon]